MNDNLIEQIQTLIDIEQRSGSMDNPSALYISRMLNVPLEATADKDDVDNIGPHKGEP